MDKDEGVKLPEHGSRAFFTAMFCAKMPREKCCEKSQKGRE